MASSIAGCATGRDTRLPPRTATEPANTNPILIYEEGLPPGVDYEVVDAEVEVAKRWYGPVADIHNMLADKARKLHANAIINVHVWYAPNFPAFAAPHGSGIAVRVKDLEKLKNSVRAEASHWL